MKYLLVVNPPKILLVGEAEVRAALLARLGDHQEVARLAAAQALAAAVGELEVRAALLARLGDRWGDVPEPAAQALAAWIAAEKFGIRPAAPF